MAPRTVVTCSAAHRRDVLRERDARAEIAADRERAVVVIRHHGAAHDEIAFDDDLWASDQDGRRAQATEDDEV